MERRIRSEPDSLDPCCSADLHGREPARQRRRPKRRRASGDMPTPTSLAVDATNLYYVGESIVIARVPK
jgi:hypothetical protein